MKHYSDRNYLNSLSRPKMYNRHIDLLGTTFLCKLSTSSPDHTETIHPTSISSNQRLEHKRNSPLNSRLTFFWIVNHIRTALAPICQACNPSCDSFFPGKSITSPVDTSLAAVTSGH